MNSKVGGGSSAGNSPRTPKPRSWRNYWHAFDGNIVEEDGKLVKKVASEDMQFTEEFGWLNGGATGYCNYPAGGIQEFAPHMMAAVPKIWDIMKKALSPSKRILTYL